MKRMFRNPLDRIPRTNSQEICCRCPCGPTRKSLSAPMRKRAAERARIESSRGWAIYLAIFQHPASFRRMLVVKRARPGSAAGHGHEPEDGRKGRRREDGGISQGISGISPRGGLVNCSVGTEGSSEEGAGDGEVDGVWVYQLRGHRSEDPAEGPREERTSRERKRGHKSRQSYGLKEAYRPRPRPSTAADAFAEKNLGPRQVRRTTAKRCERCHTREKRTSLEPGIRAMREIRTPRCRLISNRCTFFDFQNFLNPFLKRHTVQVKVKIGDSEIW